MRVFFVAAFVCCVTAAHADDIAGVKMMLPAVERRVHVTFFRASGDAPRPSVLMLHGAQGFDRQLANYTKYAATLAGRGIDTYLVDYFSNGDIDAMNNGQDVFEQRYVAWIKSVDDLAEDVLKNKDSNGKVGLVGFSDGGTIATGAGVIDPHITAAVIYYGAVPWLVAMPPMRFPDLLILHGDADKTIAVDEGKHLAELARGLGEHPDLVIYPGIGHGFGANPQSKEGGDALKRTAAFLHKELDVKN